MARGVKRNHRDILSDHFRELAAEAVERLAAVNADARAFVETLEPVVLDYCVGLARAPCHVHRWCGDPQR
jgi:hypothetical protein